MLTIEEALKVIKDNLIDLDTSELTEWACDEYIFPYLKDMHCDFAAGATKFVFLFEDTDFVIKLPYRGTIYEDEFSEFCGGFCGSWDYCETEVNLYKAAKEAGLERCFAKTTEVGTLNGHPLYAQEKALIWGDIHDINDYSEQKKRSTRERCQSGDKYYYCFHPCWLSDFLDYYGEEMFDQFMDFIEEYVIEDLHSSNLGYINGRPVVVDYSSFHN